MSKDFHVECSSRIAALIWFASSFMCAAVPPTWINQTLFLLSANLICHILATSWPPDDWLSLKRILVNWEFKRTVKTRGKVFVFRSADLILSESLSHFLPKFFKELQTMNNWPSEYSQLNLRTCTLCEDRETGLRRRPRMRNDIVGCSQTISHCHQANNLITGQISLFCFLKYKWLL